MKKFFVTTLTALMFWSFDAFSEASQTQYDEQCCRGNYCSQDCDDNSSGEYCGRYGCHRR